MKIIFHSKSMSRKSRWWVEKVISCSPISYISLWKTFQHDVFVTMSLECHLHDLLRRISMVLLLYNCVKMIFHPCVTQLYAFCFPQTFGICDIILHNWVNLIMWKHDIISSLHFVWWVWNKYRIAKANRLNWYND